MEALWDLAEIIMVSWVTEARLNVPLLSQIRSSGITRISVGENHIEQIQMVPCGLWVMVVQVSWVMGSLKLGLHPLKS